jgi:hypothetical protein
MWRNVLIQATFQLVASIVLLQHGPALLRGELDGGREHFAIAFNYFVLAQVFNELHARSIVHDANVFKGLGSNVVFLAVLGFAVVVQYLPVEKGGGFTTTVSLAPEQ